MKQVKKSSKIVSTISFSQGHPAYEIKTCQIKYRPIHIKGEKGLMV